MDAERAREDLAVIRQLMEDGRRVVVDRGKHFIIWGVVPAVGALLTYAHGGGAAVPDPTLSWCVLLMLGWGASLVVGWRDSRGARVGTLARRLLTGVWVSTGVTLTVLALAAMLGPGLSPAALPGVLSAVIAAPVLVTMQLTGERWLGLVAMGWWAGGALMLFAPGSYTLLVMAALSLVLLAVPGLVLNAKARRPSSVRNGGAAAEV